MKSVLDLYQLRQRDLSGGILPIPTSTPIPVRTSPLRPPAAKFPELTTVAEEGGAGADDVKGGSAAAAEAEVVVEEVVRPEALRSRKGWGDRSVNHLLAAVDKARELQDYR